MDAPTAHPPIILYTTPTCPDCSALKTWLGRLGYRFEEYDLTDPAIADEARARTGVRVAPITIVGDEVTYGSFALQKPVLERLLRVATSNWGTQSK